MREATLPAPQLGRDTRDILATLGYPDTQIEAMLASGAAFEGL
jgi:crotonobetainyl-CoA:carnitine CoA-transferase CaiB-like acyl-CoA transferase